MCKIFHFYNGITFKLKILCFYFYLNCFFAFTDWTTIWSLLFISQLQRNHTQKQQNGFYAYAELLERIQEVAYIALHYKMSYPTDLWKAALQDGACAYERVWCWPSTYRHQHNFYRCITTSSICLFFKSFDLKSEIHRLYILNAWDPLHANLITNIS